MAVLLTAMLEGWLKRKGRKMRGRIKVGAAISHDFGFGRWPNCKAPKGSKDPNCADDPNMVFNMKWIGRMWECTAPGFGAKEWYGNGSVFVYGAPLIVKPGEKL